MIHEFMILWLYDNYLYDIFYGKIKRRIYDVN